MRDFNWNKLFKKLIRRDSLVKMHAAVATTSMSMSMVVQELTYVARKLASLNLSKENPVGQDSSLHFQLVLASMAAQLQ